MPRYIDADALQANMMEMVSSSLYGLEDMIDAVIEAPTVSPDEVRGAGEWIKAHDDTAWWWECSVCHEPPLQRYKCDRLSNFCPNCGAKMEVSEDARKHN